MQKWIPQRGGLPHSEIHGSKPALGSPWLIAECHVLHRLLTPRHPPDALLLLDKTRRGQPDPKRADTQRLYIIPIAPNSSLLGTTSKPSLQCQIAENATAR
ncbi:Putative uncharacterized protein [Pararhodospirillum photometricum DSM 122]|uniref:Uncharacterized protein n=1 Tax=Pararhodospirillum photometricum DSM 122 TaxID=1150469 RepID=H6SIC0_PARPM|nr:Putative uncharacterized protein [Pararhodospirillum photometricum DSM 122]CCG06621.1 Putative uncharacterized protein [Pararhodospirillum photometricum DSM 122]